MSIAMPPRLWAPAGVALLHRFAVATVVYGFWASASPGKRGKPEWRGMSRQAFTPLCLGLFACGTCFLQSFSAWQGNVLLHRETLRSALSRLWKLGRGFPSLLMGLIVSGIAVFCVSGPRWADPFIG